MFKLPVLLLILADFSTAEEHRRVKRIVGGIQADPPPVDDPAVFTHFAGKYARIQGVRQASFYQFRGIKYAHPPVGKDRFLRPRQKLLEGEINATIYAPPCVQPRPGSDQVIGDEDCLALNVFSAQLPTGTEGLPVIVWVHGGGFRYGSAAQYGVRHLVGKQLVLVTIQYRLGSLGFFSSGTKDVPGNIALWDMVMAVQWVRNYIGFFGGNPYNINVMGQDTGASSILMLTLSKVAKGMINGVVAMSGTAVSRWAVDSTPQNTAVAIATQNGCPTTKPVTMVKCLQNLPAEAIIRGDSSVEFQRLHSRGFMSDLTGDWGSAPVHEGYNDGRSLPGIVEAHPQDDVDKSNNPKIPLMTGICRDETKRAVRGHLREDIVDKLQTVPDFLDKVLVQNLRNVIPVDNIKQQINDTLSSLIPLNFQNYLKLQTKNIQEALDKVADVTADALFNVPAFLTVNSWSKGGASTFLYSFEHVGKLKKGSYFLMGSPLIGNETYNGGDMNDTVAHGDDLAYIFEPQDITDGTPLESYPELAEEDQKVREIFTQMIAEFARRGKPTLEKREVLPFSGKSNNFIQIKPKPVIANDFKFCEMALWCNIADRLKSASCSFLNALDLGIKNAGAVIGGVLNPTGANILDPGSAIGKNPLNALGGGGGGGNVVESLTGSKNALGGGNVVGGLMGQKKNTGSATGSKRKQQNVLGPLGGIFG